MEQTVSQVGFMLLNWVLRLTGRTCSFSSARESRLSIGLLEAMSSLSTQSIQPLIPVKVVQVLYIFFLELPEMRPRQIVNVRVHNFELSE